MPLVDGHRLYYLETSRGYTIRATDDHRFYTPGGYLPLEQILYGGLVAVAPQSCIYGQRQMGVEDQGWVAWFVIAAITGRPITIYGNGKQVRDLLHVDDLVRAYLMASRAHRRDRRPGLQPGGRPGQHPVDLGRVRAAAG